MGGMRRAWFLDLGPQDGCIGCLWRMGAARPRLPQFTSSGL